MFDKIKAVIDKIPKPLNGEGDILSYVDKHYQAVPLSKEHFHPINKIFSKRRIAFVDSGNAEILQAANFSLQYIRICACIFEGKKKIMSKTKEFFALTEAKPTQSQNSITYCTELFAEGAAGFSIEALDRTIMQGTQAADISRIGEIARKFSELEFACTMIDELQENDIIVLDGNLQATVNHESEYLDRLYQKANGKKVIVAGFAKTTILLTKKGNSIITALNSIAPKNEWYYYPSVHISHPMHEAEVFFAKLSKHSNYVFRVDLNKNSKQYISADEFFAILAEQATDAIFPGYPYGLIYADQNAQISNREKEYLKSAVMAKAGKNEKLLQDALSSRNAHSVLNRL